MSSLTVFARDGVSPRNSQSTATTKSRPVTPRIAMPAVVTRPSITIPQTSSRYRMTRAEDRRSARPQPFFISQCGPGGSKYTAHPRSTNTGAAAVSE
eukprot:4584303-Prymnesium_polylepis.1